MFRATITAIFFLGVGTLAMAQEDPALNSKEWESAAGLLERAKELIEIGPWGKPLTDPDLAVGPDEVTCIAFAMNDALNEMGISVVDFEYAKLAMSQAIDAPPLAELTSNDDPLSVPYWGRYFMYWNDAEDRTKEEVLAAMDRAIAIANGNVETSKSNGLDGEELLEFDLENMRRLGFLD